MLGADGRGGLEGQLIMLAVGVLGYHDGARWAQRAYWLLYPAILASGLLAAAAAAAGGGASLALDVKVILTPPCIFH
jgi:hypothetical protein